jgi:hypothetical protein
MSGPKVEHEGEDMPNFDVRVSVIAVRSIMLDCKQRVYNRALRSAWLMPSPLLSPAPVLQ